MLIPPNIFPNLFTPFSGVAPTNYLYNDKTEFALYKPWIMLTEYIQI